MNPQRFLSIGILTVALPLVPRTAWASKDYPQVLQSAWNMGTKPLPVKSGKGCLLCHDTEAGGKNKATQPFGATLKKAGVVGGSPGSLRTGLSFVATRATNSDGDPVSDYREIAFDGTDPNDAKKFVPPPPPPPPPDGGGEGGTAGANGEGGGGGQGGESPVTPTQSDYPPLPPPEDLPPPYVHGCALRPGSAETDRGLALLLVAAVLVLRRRQQRA